MRVLVGRLDRERGGAEKSDLGEHAMELCLVHDVSGGTRGAVVAAGEADPRTRTTAYHRVAVELFGELKQPGHDDW